MSDSPPSINWRRSSRCESAACVEVARIDGSFALRDSGHRDVLIFGPTAWADFVAGIRAGDFEDN